MTTPKNPNEKANLVTKNNNNVIPVKHKTPINNRVKINPSDYIDIATESFHQTIPEKDE